MSRDRESRIDGARLAGLPARELTTLLVVSLLIGLSGPPQGHVSAASSVGARPAQARGDAGRGRALFNGKGICSYCHGQDGFLDRRPELAPDTEAVIARLNPLPSDLRNLKQQKLRLDKDRFRIIRDGHPGTGMFPDTTLTDQEITDILAYLAVIRLEGSPPSKRRRS